MEQALLENILDISSQMTQTRDLAVLLHYVVEQAMQLVGAERGYIVLIHENGHLDLKAGRDAEPDELSHSVLDKAIQTNE